MTKETKKQIFFVDDEPKIREVIGDTLEQLNVAVTCFASGPECLEKIESQKCDLLITDLKMTGMDGIELMKKAKNIIPWLPVLVITAYGDVPIAVKTVKSGAVDFIEKPLEKNAFLRKVQSILRDNSSFDNYPYKPLTKSEAQIFKFIIDGQSNREIAKLLHRSIRTIEVHRYRIMRKFDVDNMVDLIKKAAVLGLIEVTNQKKSHTQKSSTKKKD
ncbi:MAG: response regulator transcription factor [Sedimentisphaerales bacterium]|nr:response regulator transcription factor [Sedimentisphaerales bacterium]